MYSSILFPNILWASLSQLNTSVLASHWWYFVCAQLQHSVGDSRSGLLLLLRLGLYVVGRELSNLCISSLTLSFSDQPVHFLHGSEKLVIGLTWVSSVVFKINAKGDSAALEVLPIPRGPSLRPCLHVSLDHSAHLIYYSHSVYHFDEVFHFARDFSIPVISGFWERC